MKQEQFEKRNQNTWMVFENTLDRIETGQIGDGDIENFDRSYRQICKHLSLAADRHYSTQLVDQLNQLTTRGHQLFYRPNSRGLYGLWRLVSWDFPRAVRAEAQLFWWCNLIFYGPFIAMMILLYIDPELVYNVLPREQIVQVEEMYRNADKVEQSAASRFAMFGHYIFNNISIAFRTFAGGVFLGIGSILIMLFNGFFIGTIFGHLSQMPYSENFFSFVCTHGAFELTAIVLAGVAGFRVGLAFIAPGALSRREALRQAGERALPIVYGMTLFLLIAAFIEAFYSPIHFYAPLKYTIAAITWAGVFAYLALAGRSYGS